MRKIFGTDGIRGQANRFPMTVGLALRLGRAVGIFFNSADAGTREVLIGRDTRISGSMLEAAISAGVCSAGANAVMAGIVPTPAVALHTRANDDAIAGIMVSASHNPFQDNGIKIFNANGQKLTDATEGQLETLLFSEDPGSEGAQTDDIGTVRQAEGAGEDYLKFLQATVPKDYHLGGMKIVVDCANGAAAPVAPEIFKRLGADVVAMGTTPNGRNINAGCGSEQPAELQKAVTRHSADLGLAFDGDGDRLIAVDECGQIVNGDQILAICARMLKGRGELDHDTVVSTVMSNLGLTQALKQMGIRHLTTAVGDRYVATRMHTSGAILGGENSGHMIFARHHTTGDGLLAALKLIEALQLEHKPMSQLAEIMKVFPQTLLGVEVSRQPDLSSLEEVQVAVKSAESQLGSQGRVFVRYSGTQPLCRILVEGPDGEENKSLGDLIAGAVTNCIGIDV